jgi:hypothetical protein
MTGMMRAGKSRRKEKSFNPQLSSLRDFETLNPQASTLRENSKNFKIQNSNFRKPQTSRFKVKTSKFQPPIPKAFGAGIQ